MIDWLIIVQWFYLSIMIERSRTDSDSTIHTSWSPALQQQQQQQQNNNNKRNFNIALALETSGYTQVDAYGARPRCRSDIIYRRTVPVVADVDSQTRSQSPIDFSRGSLAGIRSPGDQQQQQQKWSNEREWRSHAAHSLELLSPLCSLFLARTAQTHNFCFFSIPHCCWDRRASGTRILW